MSRVWAALRYLLHFFGAMAGAASYRVMMDRVMTELRTAPFVWILVIWVAVGGLIALLGGG